MSVGLRSIEPDHVHVWSGLPRRLALSPYLGVQPEEIEFKSSEHGKPAIVWPRTDIEFNLSHSGELEVIAVTAGRAVGIDIEELRPERATDSIARRFFSPDELVALGRADSEQRLQRFYELWTAKEARLKALGTGIGGINDDRPDLPCTRLSLPPGYLGHVAVEAGLIMLDQF